MIDPGTLWLFTLASAAVVVVPGPTVTVIVANSLSRGLRAGLLNVLGTQLGLALMVVALAFGFAVVVERMAALFDLIRLVGALYLMWLGWKLWRADGATFSAVPEGGSEGGSGERADGGPGSGLDAARSGTSLPDVGRSGTTRSGADRSDAARARALPYVLQGFLVIWSNPKALFFFGAFIPQFVDPAASAAAQVLLLGGVFMLVGTLLDGAWALLAARAAGRVGRSRARLVERLSGTFLAGGGLWLLAAGREA